MWGKQRRKGKRDPVVEVARAESREAMAEVHALRPAVHARHHRLLELGQLLESIREENHFSTKIFGEP